MTIQSACLLLALLSAIGVLMGFALRDLITGD